MDVWQASCVQGLCLGRPLPLALLINFLQPVIWLLIRSIKRFGLLCGESGVYRIPGAERLQLPMLLGFLAAQAGEGILNSLRVLSISKVENY